MGLGSTESWAKSMSLIDIPRLLTLPLSTLTKKFRGAKFGGISWYLKTIAITLHVDSHSLVLEAHSLMGSQFKVGCVWLNCEPTSKQLHIEWLCSLCSFWTFHYLHKYFSDLQAHIRIKLKYYFYNSSWYSFSREIY